MVFYLRLRGMKVGVEVGRRPELKGLPLVLDAGGRVSDWAEEAGDLEEGGSLSRLSGRTDFVRIEEREGAYREASERLVHLAAEVFPVLEREADNALYTEGSFEDLLEIGSRLVPAFGWRMEVGEGKGKTLARLALLGGKGRKMPGGIIHPAGGDFALNRLDFLKPTERERLERLGIFRLSQLADLAESELVRLFGRRGRAIRLMAGGLDRPRDDYPRRRWIRRLDFPGGTVSREAVEAALRREAGILARFLAPRGEGVLRLSLGLEEREEERNFSRPEGREETLALALAGLWERLRPVEPVESLRIRAEGLAPRRAETLDLFGWSRPDTGPLLEDLGRRFSSRQIRRGGITPSWREEMLGFWDPWR